MYKIIFDVDPGVDDAMALIMSSLDPEIDVKLVTTIFGNVGLETTTKNACYIIQNFCKKDIPVCYGAAKALNTPAVNAQEVHGEGGLGNKIKAENVTKLPINRPGYGAIQAMRDIIFENPNEIIIVSVGPTTNIAELFIKYPEVIDKLKGLVLMVGSIDGKGSITPYSSFNAYCDPDAVSYIIEKKLPITICSKEMGTTAFFDQNQRLRFKNCSARLGPLFYDLCEGYRDMILEENQYAVHDTCALFSIYNDNLFTREKVDMKINTTQDKKRGQTKFKPNPKSHITLLKTVDKQKVFQKMEELLKLS